MEPLRREKPRKNDESLKDLFFDLTRETNALIQKEIQLAKTEIIQKTAKMRAGIGAMVGASLFGFMAFFFLLYALAVALAAFMPFWVSSLLVAILSGSVAAILFFVGKEKMQPQGLLPRHTIHSLKELKQVSRQSNSDLRVTQDDRYRRHG
jgi:hypothetical protein